MKTKVIFGELFSQYFVNFPKSDQIKIANFVNHIEKFGFDGLLGRNKSSDDVPKDDPNWLTKVAYAKQNNLWHYHIGIPKYENSTKGDWVSEYILHYIKGDDFIKIVSMSYHPPFQLPSPAELL